jgi:protein transport protein SEC31
MQLKTPPKWLRRPCGASFGFGGKLVSFENVGDAAAAAAGGGGPRPFVYLSRVVTETELVERSGMDHGPKQAVLQVHLRVFW